MPTFSKFRACLVFIVVGMLLTGMAGRVAYLQTYGRQRIIQSAERQQHSIMRAPARRGSIFERNGIALAVSVQAMALYVDPKFARQEYLKAPRTPGQLDDDLKK